VYTRTEICAYFGISGPTFQRYRAKGIVADPKIVGNGRYYSDEDVRRIRQARTVVLDGVHSYADYALNHPHPARDPHAGRPDLS